jgi:hypothetical protein
MTNHLNLVRWKSVFIDHILSDIEWAINAGRNLAAAQLILSAIDVVSGLERPADKEETSGEIFISWCDEHLALAGRSHSLTGIDLWGARCGFLHGYTPISRQVRLQRARVLSFIDSAENHVMGDEDAPNLLIVSLRSLTSLLAQGMSDSMVRLNNDQALGQLANQRMEMMFQSIDISERYSRL